MTKVALGCSLRQTELIYMMGGVPFPFPVQFLSLLNLFWEGIKRKASHQGVDSFSSFYIKGCSNLWTLFLETSTGFPFAQCDFSSYCISVEGSVFLIEAHRILILFINQTFIKHPLYFWFCVRTQNREVSRIRMVFPLLILKCRCQDRWGEPLAASGLMFKGSTAEVCAVLGSSKLIAK